MTNSYKISSPIAMLAAGLSLSLLAPIYAQSTPTVSPAKSSVPNAASPTKATVPNAAPVVELEASRKPTLTVKGDVLIRNGTLLTVTHGVLEKTDVLIRGGKIAQIGPNLTAPAGVPTIDATGKFVTPGIVDAHSHVALDSVNEGADSITAEVRMIEVVNPQSLSLYRGLSNGVTTSLLLHGSANPIGGQSVVVKMKWQHPVEDLPVPDAPRMIKFALGENVTRASYLDQATTPRFPNTRMGVEATYRRAFAEAKKYDAAWQKYEGDKATNPNAVPPRRDLRLETLADILKRKIWVQCHSYRSDEMLMMARLSKEYGFKLGALQHGLEAYKITPEIKEVGAGVSTFADAWAYKIEAFDAIPYNAALCTRAGIVTSVNSDNSSGTYRLNLEAANCEKFGGLNENEALRLVTLNPAIQLGVDGRTGSLDVGKDGDIAIWDGYPLSVYSRCAMTLIEGELLYQRRDLFGLDKTATLAPRTLHAPVDPADLKTPPMRTRYAIVGATVHPVSGPDIVNGTVTIEDGKITGVGKNVRIPSGAYVVNAKGLHVYPGLIDAGSNLGLSEVESLRATIDSSEGGEFQPDLVAQTALRPDSVHWAIARTNGITSTATCPTGGVVSGQSSIVNTDGWTAEKMSVKRLDALQITYPEGAGAFARFDLSFFPPEFLQNLRDREKAQLTQIKTYFEQAKLYAQSKAKDATSVAYDSRLEALIPYITGKLPVVINVTTAAGIRKALQFADDMGLKPIIGTSGDAWKVADLLARRKVPVLYDLPTDNSLGSTSPANEYDPTETVWAAPALLQKAGVLLAFTSGTAALAKNLPRQAGITCAYGLSHDAALKALTLNAAQILGVSDRLGSLETGKIANVIVTDGDPLEITTNVRTLFIAGRAVPITNQHIVLYEKYKQRLAEIPTTPTGKVALQKAAK